MGSEMCIRDRFLAQKRPNLAKNWHFGPNIGIFGPFDLMPDQETMRKSCVCLAQKVAPGCWAGESDYYHKDVDADQGVIILMSSLIIITKVGGVLLIEIMIIQSSL